MDGRMVPGDPGFDDEDEFPFVVEDLENFAVCLPLPTSRGAVVYCDEMLTPAVMKRLAAQLYWQAQHEEAELRRIVDGLS
jgi:hypothetical protein